MSQTYFCLAPPIVSARIVEGPGHTKVSLWEGDSMNLDLTPKLVGELTFGDVHDARVFLRTISDNHPNGRRYVGEDGPVYESYRDPTSLMLISEYGELVRLETLGTLEEEA